MEKTFEERVAEAKAQVASVSPQEAYQRMQSDSNLIVIDPRDASDIRSTTGMIPGALNVTLADIAESELPDELANPSRTIITACQGGPMGAIAAYALKLRGYTNVQFIDGGTQGWLDAGFTTH